MENIERLKQYLLTVYPVRRTAGQKAEFRKWLLSELKKSGWRAHEETYGKFNGSVNVVAGDPDRASVFLCAHYDTAARRWCRILSRPPMWRPMLSTTRWRRCCCWAAPLC